MSDRLDELEAELLGYDKKIKFCEKKLEELKEKRYLVRVALAEAIMQLEKDGKDERDK